MLDNGKVTAIVKFNRNMGCIEITLLTRDLLYWIRFNRNMGCIEICTNVGDLQFTIGLIETWDVLKFF